MAVPDLIDTLGVLRDLKLDDPSEADTRAVYVDPLLAAVGWAPTAIKREPYAGWTDSKGFIDYLLLVNGKNTMVVEAKRVGRGFEIPSQLRKQRVVTYKKLRSTANENLIEALDQALRYTQHTGAQYACLTSGVEWLFFKPSQPYRALPDARVIIFSSFEQILHDLDTFVDLLAPSALESGRTEKALSGREVLVPYFAKRLRDAFPYRREQTLEEEEYSHILDQFLAHYIEEIVDDKAFEQCYVVVHSNKRADVSLESLITERVKTLNPSPSDNTKGGWRAENAGAPLIGRTVILHGPIGVGKTSFLRNTRLSMEQSGILDSAVWVQIDLLDFRDRPFDQSTVGQMLTLLCRKIQDQVSEVTQTLSGSYDPDTWEHLRDIYNKEVRKFQKLRFPKSSDDDPVYLTAVREYVWALREEDPQEHLIRVIHWLTVHCRLPVVIVLDNSDQLGIEFQEFLYKLSQTFQRKTAAVTVIVLRTEALASHRLREHALASVMEQYQIQRAQLPTILERRFEAMASEITELRGGGISDQQRVALERMSVLMDILKYEAELGSDAYQMIDALGNDNLRDALKVVAAVFRASPKQMDRFVAMQAKGVAPRLYADTVLHAIVKHDLNAMGFNPLLPNVFLGDVSVTIPYSLPVRVLQQIKSKAAVRDYSVADCLNDFAVAGVDRDLLQRVLVRLRTDKMIVVPHMLREIGEADIVKVTKLGDFVIGSLIAFETYYDSIFFDVVIYSETTYNRLKNVWISKAETYKRFHSMGRILVETIEESDAELRKTIATSLLEPVVALPLPVPKPKPDEAS